MAKLSFKRGIILAAVTFALFTAYWALGQKFISQKLNETIRDSNASGFAITHKGVGLSGFPFAYTLRIGDPNIAFNQTQKPWSFRGENLYFKARPWSPLRWNFRHIDEARIDMRGPQKQRYLFDVTPLKIDGEIALSVSGGIKTLIASGRQVRPRDVIGSTPPVNSIENIDVTVQDRGSDAHLTLTLEDIFLHDQSLKTLQSVLGPRIETLSADIKAVDLDKIDAASWARFETNGTLRGDSFKLKWNALKINGRFIFKKSPNGISGPITVSIENEKDLLKTFEDAGIISPSQKSQILLAMTFAPKNEKGQREITFNISDNNIMFLGQPLYKF